MPWTSSDLANIDAAIASGTLEVRQGDKVVRYRSIQELKDARVEILNNIAQNSGTPQIRQVRIFTDSGY
jgi:hypothetical protein